MLWWATGREGGREGGGARIKFEHMDAEVRKLGILWRSKDPPLYICTFCEDGY